MRKESTAYFLVPVWVLIIIFTTLPLTEPPAFADDTIVPLTGKAKWKADRAKERKDKKKKAKEDRGRRRNDTHYDWHKRNRHDHEEQ